MEKLTNRLGMESSPYLLQHAHNPVDWYPWGTEAIEKARKEDKPILVSIGYAACHWCHVMERESFENEQTAALMNENFVNVKIDREERPDLDHIYMDAVQAMTGSGGWPLNVFLTPELKPFYGGTYFPPQQAYNRSSWPDVLKNVSEAFRERRHEINAQANTLIDHLLKANQVGESAFTETDFTSVFNEASVSNMYSQVLKNADRTYGGFGKAPKFPQSFTIRFLLQHHFYTKNPEALQLAALALDKMALGGIYDQVGGGFARYSTDTEWLAPHFEKMLYDNALLVIAYSEAYQITGNPLYKFVIDQTLGFINREMLSNENGFYSALDADSEGVEGKFYVWSKQEIDEILGDDAGLFSEFYDVTAGGNWEHSNILRIKQPLDEFAASRDLNTGELNIRFNNNRTKLLQARSRRIRPQLDDKILLGWNALMNQAYSKAYQALGSPEYLEMAIANMDFLWVRMRKGKNGFYHTYKNGENKFPAFLDDYAFLIQALTELQEITSDSSYLEKARSLTEWVITNFSETETGFFYFTPFDQTDVVIRKKEIYDGAVPSGNSVMAWNLYYLGVVFDKPDWKERAVRICYSLEKLIVNYPTSFGVWATFFQSVTFGIPEIALLGKDIAHKHRAFLKRYTPLRIYQSTIHEETPFPLLAGKPVTETGQFYLCKNYTCQNPVSEVDALMQLL